MHTLRTEGDAHWDGMHIGMDVCGRREGTEMGARRDGQSYRKPVREGVWWLWGRTSFTGLHGGNDIINTDHDHFITSEMSTRMQCRIQNDVTVGGDWPEPTYQSNSHNQILPDRKYYYTADYNRRKVLERGSGVVNDQSEECKGFSVTLLLSSVRNAENKDCRLINFHDNSDLGKNDTKQPEDKEALATVQNALTTASMHYGLGVCAQITGVQYWHALMNYSQLSKGSLNLVNGCVYGRAGYLGRLWKILQWTIMCAKLATEMPVNHTYCQLRRAFGMQKIKV
ncbi:hypothetical protein EDD85DRAFT_798899 [Armillaria nabsnona]|nr:hypothetical protein EDD85DRAFT_798899 [Armillaria nabsnona]